MSSGPWGGDGGPSTGRGGRSRLEPSESCPHPSPTATELGLSLPVSREPCLQSFSPGDLGKEIRALGDGRELVAAQVRVSVFGDCCKQESPTPPNTRPKRLQTSPTAWEERGGTFPLPWHRPQAIKEETTSCFPSFIHQTAVGT